MAFYVDEEEVWKCPKHPSKRRKSGICPICLRERLVSLCPDCATVRPCSCCATSSSSSSSSSFSRFSAAAAAVVDGAGVGSVGRVSNLIDIEPSFRRSRSLAIPFMRSRSRFVDRDSGDKRLPPPPSSNRSKSSFWSVFKTQKSKKTEEGGGEDERKRDEVEVDAKSMMMRSKSVGVSLLSDSSGRDVRSAKGWGWYFPSPIKVFRQSKASKVVQERSPLYRG